MYFLLLIVAGVLAYISPVLLVAVIIGALAVIAQYSKEKREREELWLKMYNEEHGTNYAKHTITDADGEIEEYY